MTTGPVPMTPWFDGARVPSREGVYARRVPAGPYACWDGRAWRSDASTPAAAALATGLSAQPHAAWRGLTSEADAPCRTCRGHAVIDHGIDVESGADLIAECPEC